MWSVSQNMDFLLKDEVKSELLYCRGCLGAGRLYNMSQYGLAEAYRQLVGVEVQESGLLPQHLCHLCRALLLKFMQFRKRCRRADTLLQKMVMLTPVVTLQDIATIDRNAEQISHSYCPTNINMITCSGLDPYQEIPQEISPQEIIPELPTDPQEIKKQTSKLQQTNNLQQTNKLHQTKCDDLLDTESEMTVKNTMTRKCENEAEDAEVKQKTKVRKRAKRRVNNLYSDPEDRLKFSQKYDVDIIVMSKEDEINEMLQRKNTSKNPRARNKCEQCYKDFIHEDTLKRHMRDKHDPSLEHECEFCRSRFVSRVSLRSHKSNLHKYKYVCRVCPIITRMRQHAIQHSKMHTQKFQCKYCGRVFNSKCTTYHTHVRSQHSAQLPWCRVCGDAFECTKTHRKLLHKETLSLPPELHCATCDTQFLNAAALLAHAHATQCATQHWCLHCGEGFQLENALRDHVLATHKVQFPCDKCNKVFSHASKLNNHKLEKHSEDPALELRVRKRDIPPAMCDICGKIITGNMRYHQRVHTGEKPHACSECPKRFRMPEQLQIHMRMHTGERPYNCKYCPNTYKTCSALSRHHLAHTGERRYPCSVCGKSFITLADVKSHVQTVHMKLTRQRRRRTRPDARQHARHHPDTNTD